MAKDEMTPVRCEIVIALADCKMRIAAAARKLYMDYSTVRYHIGIIKNITGKDPRNFYDLADLVQLVKRREEKWIY